MSSGAELELMIKKLELVINLNELSLDMHYSPEFGSFTSLVQRDKWIIDFVKNRPSYARFLTFFEILLRKESKVR
jgi:hypothetical protein